MINLAGHLGGKCYVNETNASSEIEKESTNRPMGERISQHSNPPSERAARL